MADRFRELPRPQRATVSSLLREAVSPAMAAIESEDSGGVPLVEVARPGGQSRKGCGARSACACLDSASRCHLAARSAKAAPGSAGGHSGDRSVSGRSGNPAGAERLCAPASSTGASGAITTVRRGIAAEHATPTRSPNTNTRSSSVARRGARHERDRRWAKQGREIGIRTRRWRSTMLSKVMS